MDQPTKDGRKLMRLKEVTKVTGLSRSSIYAMAKRGKFPRQTKVGARAARWVVEEVFAWIESHIADRDAAEASSAFSEPGSLLSSASSASATSTDG